MKVELSEAAEGQSLAIDAWWSENRPKAPDLFITELERAIADLREMPGIGMKYSLGAAGVRRLLLPRTQHHLYFVEEVERIVIVAIWSCRRGHGPPL